MSLYDERGNPYSKNSEATFSARIGSRFPRGSYLGTTLVANSAKNSVDELRAETQCRTVFLRYGAGHLFWRERAKERDRRAIPAKPGSLDRGARLAPRSLSSGGSQCRQIRTATPRDGSGIPAGQKTRPRIDLSNFAEGEQRIHDKSKRTCSKKRFQSCPSNFIYRYRSATELKSRNRQNAQPFYFVGVPDGIRTRVIAVKGRCPRPG